MIKEQQEMILSKRVLWLDEAKGVGIILVILGHTLISSIKNDFHWAEVLFEFIYSFHMPFFLMLSGISFALASGRYLNMNTVKYFVKKAKTLLVPYFLTLLCAN